MIEKEPQNNEEWRSFKYKRYADPIMFSAQAYEREGNQTKADIQWALWETKKAEIRLSHP